MLWLKVGNKCQLTVVNRLASLRLACKTNRVLSPCTNLWREKRKEIPATCHLLCRFIKKQTNPVARRSPFTVNTSQFHAQRRTFPCLVISSPRPGSKTAFMHPLGNLAAWKCVLLQSQICVEADYSCEILWAGKTETVPMRWLVARDQAFPARHAGKTCFPLRFLVKFGKKKATCLHHLHSPQISWSVHNMLLPHRRSFSVLLTPFKCINHILIPT